MVVAYRSNQRISQLQTAGLFIINVSTVVNCLKHEPYFQLKHFDVKQQIMLWSVTNGKNLVGQHNILALMLNCAALIYKDVSKK